MRPLPNSAERRWEGDHPSRQWPREVRATSVGWLPGVVPRLDGRSVTLTADLADIVVTEYGTAVPRGKSPLERAEALIAVADPQQRERLADSLAHIR